ncbi:outer membrane beta-barrel family protein [uncultured Duncaniella sp.]|uniref:outer membrane beta-barrel family protein n=1 Tax=uncultured Duncaniella sp. TaxID=2768039 RepID=UPI0025A937FE|nr:outer membrane beta-barrel family protein [uncultured Duncaniella sp.]
MSKVILPFILILSVAFTARAQQPSVTPTQPSDSLVRELGEVVVTARDQSTRLVGNSLVSTIAGTPLAELGNALDVLSQLPMIKVSDDEVSIHGKGSPLIYIDNRPVSDSFDLRTLRSRNIRNVELILAPGAEYDATVGAVLKITTRRTFIEGLSLDDELQGKAARSLTGYEILNLRYFFRSSTELFATGLAAHNNSVMRGATANSLDYEGQPTVVGSSQSIRRPSNNLSAKFGFNQTFGSLSFGAWYKVLREDGHFSNHGSEWLDDNPLIERNITKRISGTNHYSQYYLDKSFASGGRIHFDGSLIDRNTRSATTTAYTLSDLYPDVSSTQRYDSRLYAGKLTYSMPLSKGSLVVGTEDSYTTTRVDYRMLNEEIGSYIPSALSEVAQTSLAGFASYSAGFGKLGLTAGLRYEYKNFSYRLDGKRDDSLSRRDNFVTPDISLSCDFSGDGSKSLSLSYKSFTELPPYSSLSDGLSYTGVHEIEGGNPALRDGRSHQLQLLGMMGDFMMQATFRRSFDTYGFIKRIYPADNLQLIFQPVNFNVSAAWVYFVWQRRIGCWQPVLTLGVNPQWLEVEGEKYDKPVYAWFFDNTLSLPFGILLTANLYGQSSGYIHTQLMESKPLMMDAGIQKSFLGKSLTVKLSASNIFNSRRDGWRLRSYGVDMIKRQTYDNRYIALTLSYSFQPRKSSYKGSDAASSEINRL